MVEQHGGACSQNWDECVFSSAFLFVFRPGHYQCARQALCLAAEYNNPNTPDGRKLAGSSITREGEILALLTSSTDPHPGTLPSKTAKLLADSFLSFFGRYPHLLFRAFRHVHLNTGQISGKVSQSSDEQQSALPRS